MGERSAGAAVFEARRRRTREGLQWSALGPEPAAHRTTVPTIPGLTQGHLGFRGRVGVGAADAPKALDDTYDRVQWDEAFAGYPDVRAEANDVPPSRASPGTTKRSCSFKRNSRQRRRRSR